MVLLLSGGQSRIIITYATSGEWLNHTRISSYRGTVVWARLRTRIFLNNMLQAPFTQTEGILLLVSLQPWYADHTHRIINR